MMMTVRPTHAPLSSTMPVDNTFSPEAKTKVWSPEAKTWETLYSSVDSSGIVAGIALATVGVRNRNSRRFRFRAASSHSTFVHGDIKRNRFRGLVNVLV